MDINKKFKAEFLAIIGCAGINIRWLKEIPAEKLAKSGFCASEILCKQKVHAGICNGNAHDPLLPQIEFLKLVIDEWRIAGYKRSLHVINWSFHKFHFLFFWRIVSHLQQEMK